MTLMRLSALSMNRQIATFLRPATTHAHIKWFAKDAKGGSSRNSSAPPAKPNVRPQDVLKSCTPDPSTIAAKRAAIVSASARPLTGSSGSTPAPTPTSTPPTSFSAPKAAAPTTASAASNTAASPPTAAPVSNTSTAPPSASAASTTDSTSSSSSPPPQNNNLWLAILAALAGGGILTYFWLRKSDDDDQVKPISKILAPVASVKIPPTSAEIPKEVPYLLIGGGTASFAAFRAIKSHDPKAKVLVISDESETPYMRPPLSKELWLSNYAKDATAKSGELKFKQWNGVERSLYYEPNDFYISPTKLVDEVNGGVAIVRGYKVARIDVMARTAYLTDGTAIKYDECLLATGSAPKTLEIFEQASRKIQDKCSVFKTIEDYCQLKKIVDKSKSIAVIGGGFLGSELACALAKYGETKKLKVHQIFHEKGNMGKVLPEFLSEWTTERVREEGVNVIPNTQVQSVELLNGQLNLKLIDGKSVLCDHAIVAVGSTPNVAIAKDSGLEVDGTFGGYLVNAELEARRHLYVAGDAACFYDPKLGRRRVEHHDHAVVSGRLAGENMVGLKKPYTHQSMFWSDLGPNVGYEAIGIIDSSLPTVSVFAKRTPEELTARKEEGAEPSATSTESEKASPAAVTPSNSDEDQKKESFDKGVVFYLRDDKIIGIVLWNVFNRINTARAVIGENKKYDDLNEVAKLFDIHT